MLKLQFRDQPGKFVKLSQAALTLGRDDSNDVVIDAPSVSDFHAEITADAQHISVVDLLSASGTFVNEHRINGRCQLKAWDVIRLGTVELEVIDPSERRPEDWALSIESDLLASQFYPLGPKTVVGRDPACDLTIDSRLLSRRHAELTIEGDHLRVVDLGSANGTFINGQKVDEGIARPGDELRFDQERFVVLGPQKAGAPGGGHDDQTMLRDQLPEATVFAAVAEAKSQPTPQPQPAPDPPAEATENTLIDIEEETRLFVPPPLPASLVPLDATQGEGAIRLGSDSCIIGRSEACDIVLRDKSVSKRHAELTGTPRHWTIRDLGSSNGVWVNGEKVDEVRLAIGDRLKLGRLTFEFLTEGEGTGEREPVTMIYQAPRGRAEAAAPKTDAKVKPRTTRRGAWAASLLLAAVVVLGALWFVAGSEKNAESDDPVQQVKEWVQGLFGRMAPGGNHSSSESTTR